MSKENDPVRASMRISRETHERLETLIPWGMRRDVLEVVLQLVLDAIEEDGMVVAGAILDGKFKLVRVEVQGIQPPRE